MLSFVIIGRNEARNIARCLDSVRATIRENTLTNAEIIYVDSNSTDGTIDNVRKYPEVAIYKITEGWNAAAARNIGAQHATHDILFFIDGDMSINSSFIPCVMKNGQMKHDFVTGSLYEYQYNAKGELIHEYWRTRSPVEAKRIYFTGGIFLMKKSTWELIGGMDVRMRKAQDGDLCMRLHRNGVKMYSVQEKIADHHTIDYLHSHRIWSTLCNGDVLYAKSVLYRRYITYRPIIKRILAHDYTAVALVLALIASLLINRYILLLYPLLVLFKVIKQKNISLLNRLQLLPYYILRDILVLFGAVCWYPSVPKTSYTKVC